MTTMYSHTKLNADASGQRGSGQDVVLTRDICKQRASHQTPFTNLLIKVVLALGTRSYTIAYYLKGCLQR